MEELIIMEDGRYAIHNGEVYEFSREDGQDYLISRNAKDLRNGFYKDYDNCLRKDVKKEDVESIFILRTVCNYKGYKKYFEIDEVKGDKIKISTADHDLYDELLKSNIVMEEVGKQEYYIMWVDEKDVDYFKVVKTIYGTNEDRIIKVPKNFKRKLGEALNTFKNLTIRKAVTIPKKLWKKTPSFGLPTL